MSGKLGAVENEFTERSQLIAGESTMKPITVASGTTTMVRGTVVGINTTTYKYGKLNSAAADGTEVARMILAEDIDASAGDAMGQAHGPGEYRDVDIVWPVGITAGQKNAALLQLQDRGLIIK